MLLQWFEMASTNLKVHLGPCCESEPDDYFFSPSSFLVALKERLRAADSSAAGVPWKENVGLSASVCFLLFLLLQMGLCVLLVCLKE